MVDSTPNYPADDRDGSRHFRGVRKVRLGDVTSSGRLRLDALTRYTQDVSDDDTSNAGLPAEPAWVVRRTVVEINAPAILGEEIELTTHCCGLGRHWAERHLRVVGTSGASYGVSTLWICVDRTSGRPQRLTQEFLGLYGSAAAGRKVSARLTHGKPPEEASQGPWPLRVVDFDTLGHVNNAAYWAVVEEVLDRCEPAGPFRASIEYRHELTPKTQVSIVESESDGVRGLWWLLDDRTVPASARIASG